MNVSAETLWTGLHCQHKGIIMDTLEAVNTYRATSDEAIANGSTKAVGDRQFAKRFGDILSSVHASTSTDATASGPPDCQLGGVAKACAAIMDVDYLKLLLEISHYSRF